MLYGERVRLRAIEREDIPTFVRWLNDPQVRQYLLMFEPMSKAKEERWFEKKVQAEDHRQCKRRRSVRGTARPWATAASLRSANCQSKRAAKFWRSSAAVWVGCAVSYSSWAVGGAPFHHTSGRMPTFASTRMAARDDALSAAGRSNFLYCNFQDGYM
jgi:hypothetical protein